MNKWNVLRIYKQQTILQENILIPICSKKKFSYVYDCNENNFFLLLSERLTTTKDTPQRKNISISRLQLNALMLRPTLSYCKRYSKKNISISRLQPHK